MYEFILAIDIHIGLLHRSVDKLIEIKVWNQALGYFDRLDYVSSIVYEEVFICSLELINDVDCIYIMNRLFIIELIRIINHLLAISCHLGDVRAISFILWMFEDRERIIYYLDRMIGKHCFYFRLFNNKSIVLIEVIDDLFIFIVLSSNRIDDLYWYLYIYFI